MKAKTLDPTAVVLDDDGDLTLVVGADEMKFVVCSRTVSRASPVFRQMLNGPFIEARPPADSDDPWIVTLPEDRSETMTVILCIMHGQFAKVPRTLDGYKLYRTLVLTEKYDMTEIIAPWVKGWMGSHNALVNEWGFVSAVGVAWEVGATATLEALANKLIMTSGITRNGVLLIGNTLIDPKNHSLPLVPPGFFESVATARSMILEGLFRQLGQVVVNLEILVTDRHTGTSRRPEAYCKRAVGTWDTDTRKVCHAATLGVLHAWLGQLLQYAPRPAQYMVHAWVPKSSYPDSVNKAIETIKTFKFDLYEKGIHSSGYSQKQPYGCSPIAAILEDIDKLVTEHRVTISKENIARMKKQQQKLGVDWGFLSKSN
ncbi:hypothetical protein QBC37DRAFT_378601 [Rhypophila decipiens]|uniref:BTB domain-containing protein n=1 Tax=Rhypophila decipiens TaxID=261697 RepID=A0AAN6XXU5_9PEZI|nr:hypothetical protein QBC37DRAFT_378601 [Rhypophila decipiens]